MNAEHKQADKRSAVFNWRLIVFNIEQMTAITGILDANAAAVNGEKVRLMAAPPASAFVYTDSGGGEDVGRKWD